MTIPFEIALHLYRQDVSQPHIHHVQFGVAGADQSSQVLITSDDYANARVSKRIDDGGLRLRPDLFYRLAIECFRGAVNQLIEQDSSLVVWTQADATCWLRRAGFGNDLDVVLRQLRQRVQSNKVFENAVQVTF